MICCFGSAIFEDYDGVLAAGMIREGRGEVMAMVGKPVSVSVDSLETAMDFREYTR